MTVHHDVEGSGTAWLAAQIAADQPSLPAALRKASTRVCQYAGMLEGALVGYHPLEGYLLAHEKVLVGPFAVLGEVAVDDPPGISSHDGHPLQVVGEDPKADPGGRARQAAQPGAAQPKATLEVADARFDADPPVAQPPERAGAFQLAPGGAGGAGTLQPDPPDAELGQGAVVGGEPEAAVGDHCGWWAAVSCGYSANGGEQLEGVGRVALVELVVGDEAALVLGQQQGVAELGRAAGFALADRAGVGVGQGHHPVGNLTVAGQPLLGLPEQPPGELDGLVELAGQPFRFSKK